jgi:AraC-like DNA-binding protein
MRLSHYPERRPVLKETAIWHPEIMRRLAADWVPDGAWLAPGYAEWLPPAALRGTVACLWARVVPDDVAATEGLVLPDGCSDLVWERGAGAYVAGPDTGPVRTSAPAGSVLAGVRFRPAAGGAALNLPLSEVRDQRVGLADLLPSGGARPAAGGGRLPADLPPAAAAARLLDIAGRLIADGTPDPAMTRAAAMLRDPTVRADDVAAAIGLSERQFRRRCHAAAGYGPKTLQRVFRFQRFVRRIDASAGAPEGASDPLDLAAAAAEAGYADQAHLTRECAALSGLTPAVLARTRR